MQQNEIMFNFHSGLCVGLWCIVKVVMFINHYTILPATEISTGLEGIEDPALLTALTVTVRYRLLQVATLSPSGVQNTVIFMVVFSLSGWYTREEIVAFSPAEVCRLTWKCVESLVFSERLTLSGRLILVTCRDEKNTTHKLLWPNYRAVSISHNNDEAKQKSWQSCRSNSAQGSGLNRQTTSTLHITEPQWLLAFRFHLITHQTCLRTSLVPRLPCSGTRTLKLCRRGEPGIFCHVKSAKDRLEVDATLIVHGRMRLRTEIGTKVANNLLHVYSYRASNNIHTERWSIVGRTTCKTLPFCFSPILMTSCLRSKDTRLSVRYIFAFQESLGTRLS